LRHGECFASTRQSLRARFARRRRDPETGGEILSAENLSQPFEKARFERENPRKTKEIKLP
jgi:hypothetical protein